MEVAKGHTGGLSEGHIPFPFLEQVWHILHKDNILLGIDAHTLPICIDGVDNLAVSHIRLAHQQAGPSHLP
jgi:hypothetical protein